MLISTSAFSIGIIFVLIGAVWTGISFSTTIKESKSIALDRLESARISVELSGNGLGYYVISSSTYDSIILAKILDSQDNYIEMKRITNKLTMNYFQFDKTGEFTLEITNFSDKPVELTAEIGDTGYQNFALPAIIILLGTIFLIITGYKKLHRYITAQPDENS